MHGKLVCFLSIFACLDKIVQKVPDFTGILGIGEYGMENFLEDLLIVRDGGKFC